MSFLAEGEDEITIGELTDERIGVRASPLTWEVPVSINEESLGTAVPDAEDVLPGRFDDEEDDEEGETDE
jgi:hypothetical protein